MLLGVIVFLSFLHAAIPETCQKSCNVHEEPVNNCSACKCQTGYFNDTLLGACRKCKVCKKPEVIRVECFGQFDTECGPCEKGQFYTVNGCRNCSTCVFDVMIQCGVDQDTICHTRTNKTPTIISWRIEYRESNNKTWFVVAVVSIALLVFMVIIVIVIVLKFRRRRLYSPVDASSLATNSATSLVQKSGVRQSTSHCSLTEEELGTLIRTLPGTYADQLGKLLNPRSSNNWKSLAGVLDYTQIQIANFKSDNSSYPEYTQNLLLDWGSRNSATVKSLGEALKKIERDDAYRVFHDFILSLRQHNDETTVFFNEDEVSESDITLIN